MIALTCAQCQARLEVDDAFAGGVCRCQHCGTIQTVPKPGEVPVGGAAAETPRALYQVQSRAGQSSAPSGLEELAEVIHSSGLAGSGLQHSRRGLEAHEPVRKNPVPLIAAVGGGVVILVLIVVLVIVLKSGAPAAPTALPDGTAIVTAANSNAPNFANIPLVGDKIIFVIDRGDATVDYIPDIKVLTDRAVRSLGSDRRYQVVLWDNGAVDSFPSLGTDFATDEQANKLSAWFDEVSTGRPTDALPAIRAALTQSPDTIVLVTGKGGTLTDSQPAFAAEVLGLLQGRKVTIHGITLGDTAADDPLKKLALETGGHFVAIKRSDLDALAN